ncbi:MAG: phosphoribosylglycinamide formyltransferase [Actinomycetota bacterium]
MRLGFLASHGGSSMQVIADACRSGNLDAEVRVVISNNTGSLAMQRAGERGIPTVHLSGLTHPDAGALDAAIARTLTEYGVQMLLLSGYVKLVGPRTLAAFPARILNIHPSLLPRFGGTGMYGKRVHQAVLDAGEAVTGVTIHLLDEQYDRGPIVAQSSLAVLPGDDAGSLADRVAVEEHRLYVDTVRRIAAGEIDLDRLR